MKTMDHVCVDGVLIVAHLAHNPSDKEWAVWLDRMARTDYTSVLIVTEGGAPTPTQRKATNQFWEGRRKPKMAVISDSAVVRGAIFTFYWLFKGDMRPFSPRHLGDALTFLEVPSGSLVKVREAARRLDVELKSQLRVA